MKILPNYTCNASNSSTVQKNKNNSNNPTFGTLNIDAFVKSLDTPEGMRSIAKLYSPKYHNPLEVKKNLLAEATKLKDKVKGDGLLELILGITDKSFIMKASDDLAEMELAKKIGCSFVDEFNPPISIEQAYDTKQIQMRMLVDTVNKIKNNPMLKKISNVISTEEFFTMPQSSNLDINQKLEFIEKLFKESDSATKGLSVEQYKNMTPAEFSLVVYPPDIDWFGKRLRNESRFNFQIKFKIEDNNLMELAKSIGVDTTAKDCVNINTKYIKRNSDKAAENIKEAGNKIISTFDKIKILHDNLLALAGTQTQK